MKRNIGVMVLALFWVACVGIFAAQTATAPKGAREPLDLSRIRLTGSLWERVNLGLAHLIDTRERLLTAEGHTQGWGSDGVGRWVYGVTRIAACKGNAIPELDAMVQDLLAVQQQDGSWGAGEWGHWGNSRVAIGLVEYWDMTHKPDVMEGLKKLVDFYEADYDRIFSRGTSNPLLVSEGDIETLVLLGRATGDPRCLALARRVADFCIKRGRMMDPNQHAHVVVLSGLRGLAELYRTTGETKYLQEAEKIHAWVLDRYMWVTGGIGEVLSTPFETKDETCQVADWLRSSFVLWQITGNPKYMDVAELVYINHLLFNQDSSGGFCSYRSIGIGPATSFAGRDFTTWWCCSMHGMWELLGGVKYIYTRGEDSVAVNLFVRSEADIPLRAGKVKLRQLKDYSGDLDADLEVEPEKPMEFTLRLRMPGWATGCRVALNGAPVDDPPHHGYLAITRVWRPGDRVRTQFAAGLRIVPDGINSLSRALANFRITDQTRKVSRGVVLYGPFVLMVDPVLNPHEMYTWESLEIMAPRDENGGIVLPKPAKPVAGRGKLLVPGACFMALGRGLKMPEKVTENIIDPTRQESATQPAVPEKTPDLGDEAWKVVFLTPVSELTDRRTVTLHRRAPYEVRNDIHLLDKAQNEAFRARVQGNFNRLRENKWLKTTGHRIYMLHQGIKE